MIDAYKAFMITANLGVMCMMYEHINAVLENNRKSLENDANTVRLLVEQNKYAAIQRAEILQGFSALTARVEKVRACDMAWGAK